MKKQIIFMSILSFVFLAGCGSISNMLEKATKDLDKKAEKWMDDGAKNLVDKELGSGTWDDTKRMSKEKYKVVGKYLTKLNKRCDEKKITKEFRDAKKSEIEALYDKMQAGEVTDTDFHKKADELSKAEE